MLPSSVSFASTRRIRSFLHHPQTFNTVMFDSFGKKDEVGADKVVERVIQSVLKHVLISFKPAGKTTQGGPAFKARP
jgi:hypothetical protein